MAKTVKFRAKMTVEADFEFDYEGYDESPTLDQIIKIETEEMGYLESDYFYLENADDRRLTVELIDVRIVEEDVQ